MPKENGILSQVNQHPEKTEAHSIVSKRKANLDLWNALY
jgi:hypothetical protein